MVYLQVATYLTVNETERGKYYLRFTAPASRYHKNYEAIVSYRKLIQQYLWSLEVKNEEQDEQINVLDNMHCISAA